MALSRGLPRVGVTHRPALWSPDFPRRRLPEPTPTRPPGHLIRVFQHRAPDGLDFQAQGSDLDAAVPGRVGDAGTPSPRPGGARGRTGKARWMGRPWRDRISLARGSTTPALSGHSRPPRRPRPRPSSAAAARPSHHRSPSASTAHRDSQLRRLPAARRDQSAARRRGGASPTRRT
ncbi:hypothetical protein FAGKG844_170053 [Frankia sp. AgKG'84/4]